MLNGNMSALRWVRGSEWDFIDTQLHGLKAAHWAAFFV